MLWLKYTPKDIIDDVVIIPDPYMTFNNPYEFEEGEIFEDVIVYVDYFEVWYMSKGEESCEEDVIKFHHPMLSWWILCPIIIIYALIHLFCHPPSI